MDHGNPFEQCVNRTKSAISLVALHEAQIFLLTRLLTRLIPSQYELLLAKHTTNA